MKFCSECGSKLSPKTKFCGSCGNKVIQDEIVVRPQIKSQIRKVEHTDKRNSGNTIGKIIILAFVLLGAVYVLPHLWIVGQATGINTPVTQPPQVSISSASLSGISLSGANLNVVLDVYNPNSISITLDKATYQAYINDNYVGQGNIATSTTVNPTSHAYPTSSLSVGWGGGLNYVGQQLLGIVSGKKPTLKLQGTAYIDVPILGSVQVPFSHSSQV